MTTHTCEQIARDWSLWGEYVDPDGIMSKGKFDSMAVADKIAIMHENFPGECYGCETEGEVAANVTLDKLADEAEILWSQTEADKLDARDMEWEREDEEDYIAPDLLPRAAGDYEDYAYLLPRLE